MEREQHRSGILNDECGLGKTIQRLEMIALRKSGGARQSVPRLSSPLPPLWMFGSGSTTRISLRHFPWYGRIGLGGTIDPVRKRYHVAAEGLNTMLAGLDKNDRLPGIILVFARVILDE